MKEIEARDRATELLNDYDNQIISRNIFIKRFEDFCNQTRLEAIKERICDVCGSDDIGVCVDCHCKQIVESRKEGHSQGLAEAAKVAFNWNCRLGDKIADQIRTLAKKDGK